MQLPAGHVACSRECITCSTCGMFRVTGSAGYLDDPASRGDTVEHKLIGACGCPGACGWPHHARRCRRTAQCTDGAVDAKGALPSLPPAIHAASQGAAVMPCAAARAACCCQGARRLVVAGILSALLGRPRLGHAGLLLKQAVLTPGHVCAVHVARRTRTARVAGSGQWCVGG